MATFKGLAGIEALKKKIEAQSKVLVMSATIELTHKLIEDSPVGVEIYPAKTGAVENDPGDFKNSWAVGIGSKNSVVRSADPSGGTAYAAAISDSLKYALQDDVYVTNSVKHADEVESGWTAQKDPSREFRGWVDRDGYGVVSGTQADVAAILQEALRRAQNAKGVDV